MPFLEQQLMRNAILVEVTNFGDRVVIIAQVECHPPVGQK